MTDKPKAAKAVKKGDPATVTDSSQVNVTFTLSFTATLAPDPSPPCFVYDYRFSFSLFSTNPTITSPLGTWSPLTTPADDAITADAVAPPSPPPTLTWASSVDVTVGREQLLSMERGIVTIAVEQRAAYVAEEKQPAVVEELASPSKAAAKAKAAAAAAPAL